MLKTLPNLSNDEDFEPAVATDKWDGEDEDDDDIKDNWDDEEEDDSAKKAESVPAPQPKKNKSKAERIAEKQEQRRIEMQKKQEELIREQEKELTAEEQLAEKLKRQKLQEESDLELAMDAFGVDALPGVKTIDNFHPTNKDEFMELSTMISKKLVKYENKSEYVTFLETLFRDSLAGVDAEQIKRISNTLNILATEKQKLAKSSKGGKKKAAAKKTTLSSGKGSNRDDIDYEDDFYNEYEDFM